jgi:ATP-dependent RNA helicase RhlE
LTTTFQDFGLSDSILKAITEMGYQTPTPIQAEAIPVILEGRDVMGAAQTGTGKTAGFGLPLLQRLMPHANPSTSPARHPIRALILAPTRELADQIFENLRDYAKYSSLRCGVVFGGVDIKPQLAAMRLGCEVVVATPGRLLDHMEQKSINLSQVEVLVLDEADRMLDMGFLPDLQRIVRTLPVKRQSLLFSATFSNEIRRLAGTFLTDPTTIEVARRNATAENVKQIVYKVASSEAKRNAVAALIEKHALSQVIVFSNTKIGCGRLARHLQKLDLNADAIHGDKSQQDRLVTLDNFKSGKTRVLVATDVAARGLDIAELPAVINYDLPYSPEDYVHRIGRTGRAGASGLALSIMSSEDGRLLADIEKLTKFKFEIETLDFAPPASPAVSETPERESRPKERPVRERASRDAARHQSKPGTGTGFSNDPFFFKPYESIEEQSSSSQQAAELAVAAAAPSRPLTGVRRSTAPVAALLGGKR